MVAHSICGSGGGPGRWYRRVTERAMATNTVKGRTERRSIKKTGLSLNSGKKSLQGCFSGDMKTADTIGNGGRITENRRQLTGVRKKFRWNEFFRVFETKGVKWEGSMTVRMKQELNFERVDDVTYSGRRYADDVSNDNINPKINWAKLLKGAAEFLKFNWKKGQNILSPRPYDVGVVEQVRRFIGFRWWLAGVGEKAVRERRAQVILWFLVLKEEDNTYGIFGFGVNGIWWWYTGDEKMADLAGEAGWSTRNRRWMVGERKKWEGKVDFLGLFSFKEREWKMKEMETGAVPFIFEHEDDVIWVVDDISNSRMN